MPDKTHSIYFDISERIALEPRIVFDGAAVATAIAADEAASVDDNNNEADDVSSATIPQPANSEQTPTTEIAFIDMRLPNAADLAAEMRDGVLVVMIDPAQNGLDQISQTLNQHDNIDAVHILSHGDDNGFKIGSTLITADTINDQSDGFASWAPALSEHADILIYGCNVAETAEGQALLATIGDLTSADISASTDLTGAAALGGDWDLEFNRGAIETSVALTQNGQANYQSVMAAVPEATISAPADPLIGEQVTLTVTFDNTDAIDAGYGPYVNLFLPYLGADGVYNAGTDTYTSSADGVSFVSATYLGETVDSTIITLEDINGGLGGIQFEHPVAIDTAGDPVVVTLDAALGLQEGDQLVLLQLPFGSYTPGQPAADIEVTLNVSADADVGTGLDVITEAGFIYGNTALNDFDTDPSIQAVTLNAGNTNSASLTPQLFRVNTSLNAPEGETATGPNFERSYTISVEVAAGETIDAASVDFTFAEEFVYTDAVASGGGVVDLASLTQAAGGDLSDDVLTVDFAALSGTQTITIDFYVDEFDQSGADVLNPLTGASQSLGELNNIDVNGTWTPNDVRDAAGPVTTTESAPQITARSIATQKDVSIVNDTNAVGATPGDTLEYTIDVQISDFFAYDTITLQDIFADGQLLDGGFTPTLTVSRQGAASGPFNFTVGVDFIDTTLGNDDHQLDIDVSALLNAQLASGILEGGKFGADDLGGTTATITYRTVIQDEYDSEAGNLNLKQGDSLASSVTVEGRLLDGALSPVIGPVMVTDTSGASVTVPNETVSLSIYALNGSTLGPLTDIKPGDDVTFRLEYDLVTGDLEDFLLDAYLPLPVFSVDDIDANGAGGDSFVLDNGSAIPTVGDFRYGPTATADITGGIPAPTVSTDVTSNFVRFDLGDLSDATNDGGKIDILFTIRATNDPFADGLLLTTLSQQSDNDTAATSSISNDLGQITLQEPEITEIIKGVVATDVSGGTFTPTYSSGTPSGIKDAGNTDANPLNTTINSTNLDSLNLDGDLTGVDEGDLVRFAIIIENTGSSPNGAFDLTISDTMPAGFVVPGGGINLRVVNGAGTTIGVDTASPDTALFAGGIVLSDGGTGAIANYDPADGENIIIITYDLEVDNLAEAGADLVNTATLSNYANTEGGPDFTSVDLTDTATVSIAGASLNKVITATDQAHTAGNNVVVGEIVEYTLTITMPEGLSSTVSLVDTLDSGMSFVAIDSITASSGDITTSIAGGFANVQAGVVFSNVGGGVDNDGRRATFDFGNVTNVNTDNSTDETITIVYRAIVANTSNTDGGATLNNSAVWTSSDDSDSDTAPNVTVVEPQVNVSITPDVSQADTSDTITWTVVLTAPGGNQADAFDINFDNTIPAGLTYVPASLTNTAGVAPGTLTENGGDFNATYASLTPGQTSTFTFQTTIDTGAGIGDTLTNSGTVTWHSISGALGDPSANTTVDTERTGAGGINDYTTTANGDVDILFQAPVLTLEDSSESATAGSDVAVGEIVRYRFVMRIPESTTADFRVEPEIPAGLQYLNDGTTTIAFVSDGGLSANGAGLAGNGLVVGNEGTVAGIDPTFVIPGGLISGGPFTDGDNPQFQLGTLTNLDSDINQEFVVIEYNALVLNAASVNDGATLSSDADVLEGVTSIIRSNNVDIDIVEPSLGNLTKEVISTDGTTATFRITFDNTSGVDAFNINVNEALPANIGNIQNVTITPAGGVSAGVNTSTATTLDIDFADFPDGGSVTITYTADVTDTTAIVADNDVDVTWTSIDGATSSLTTAPGTSTSGASGSTTGDRDGSAAPAQNDYLISEGAGLNVISGTLWSDANLDDVIDGGEDRIANTQVNLIFAGIDGIFGNGDDVTLSTITDINGDYNFGALPTGDYRISVQPNGQPNGLNAVYNHVYDPTGADNDNLIERTLGEGVTSAANNFGVFDVPEPPSGTDKEFTIDEDERLNFEEVDFGFSDPDIGDFFDNVRIDTLPDEGILYLDNVPVVMGQIIPVAQIPDLNFRPDDGEFGAPYTSFTFSVQDQSGLFDVAPNTFTINVEEVPDTSFVIPPDPTPIPGTGTVPPVPPSGPGPQPPPYVGAPPPEVDPVSGIRTFEVTPSSLSDINFEGNYGRPDLWIIGAVDQKLLIETKEMTFQVSKGLFKHSDPGEQLSFEAEQQDGSPLPDWLSFDSGDLTFKGTAPLGSPKALELVIIARDSHNNEVKAPVRVVINREVEGGETAVPVNENGSNIEQAAPPEQNEGENAEDTNENEEAPKEEKGGFLDLKQIEKLQGKPKFSDQIFNETRHAEVLEQTKFIKSI